MHGELVISDYDEELRKETSEYVWYVASTDLQTIKHLLKMHL